MLAAFVAAAVALAGWVPPVPAAAARTLAPDEIDPARLLQVRAAFVLNFLRFAEWPEARLADAEAPLRIAVLGDDPIGSAIAAAVRGRRIHDREVRVVAIRIDARAIRTTESGVVLSEDLRRSIAAAHLLHLPESLGRTPDERRAIARAASEAAVLVTGEPRRAIDEGVVVAMPVMDGRVRPVVGRAALDAGSVRLGARLLELAVVVDGEGGS